MGTYALIRTDAPSAIVRRQDFDQAPELSENKPLKWISDDPPTFSPAKQTCTQTTPVPVDATEVPYVVADIPLADIKATALSKLYEAFDVRGRFLIADYPSTETMTWDQQVRAARAYQAEPSGDNSYLEDMCLEDETVADLADLILANSATYLEASGALIKNRRVLEAAIEACETADDVLAIDVSAGWPF